MSSQEDSNSTQPTQYAFCIIFRQTQPIEENKMTTQKSKPKKNIKKGK
jgi:hypothetical protein